MKSEYESYSPDTREILEAFTDGINAYIARRGAPGGHGFPVEFQIAGFQPEPWKPTDCLNRMAAFSMTGNAFEELAHAQATMASGTDAASLLFDFDPPVKLDPAPATDLGGSLSEACCVIWLEATRVLSFPSHHKKVITGRSPAN